MDLEKRGVLKLDIDLLNFDMYQTSRHMFSHVFVVVENLLNNEFQGLVEFYQELKDLGNKM